MIHKEHLVMPTILGLDVVESASNELDDRIGDQECKVELEVLLGDTDKETSWQMGDGKKVKAEYEDV